MNPPRPHPFARSNFAEAANRFIGRCWDKGWTEMPRIEPDWLWQMGAKGFDKADETALRSEEDVADFRLRLEMLCQSLREDAQLNALGRTMAYGQLKNAIRHRHALGRLWRAKPELAATTLAPPIIVLGQMRSGTTRVQRLLAADPQHAGTRFCDSHDPVPNTPDWRPLKARFTLFMARRVNPWLDTLHPFGATRADEEIGWLAAALSPAAFEAQWRIGSYLAFSEARGAGAVYREFARILRTDAAFHRNADKPRVLKCPQFAEDMPALMAQFPDARIVRCEREAEAVLASSVSMVASQMAFQSDTHDAGSLHAEWQRKMALREARMDDYMAGFGGRHALARFEDLNEAPHDLLDELYRSIGPKYGTSARQAVTRQLEHAAKGKFRHHKAQIAAIRQDMRPRSG